MRNIKYLFATLTITLLISCSSGGGGSSSKDLFSLWNDVEDDTPLDLTGSDFSTDIPFNFFFAGGAQCNCDLTVLGTQKSGTYIVNSCFYQSGSGSGDPGCNALNDTGTYTNSSGTLKIINSAQDVTTYK